MSAEAFRPARNGAMRQQMHVAAKWVLLAALGLSLRAVALEAPASSDELVPVQTPVSAEVAIAVAPGDSHFYDALIAYSTVALAVVTGLLWYATYRLGREARATSEQQRVEVQRSLAIAENQNVALRDVAEATRSNATQVQSLLSRQMRAFVSVNIGRTLTQLGDIRFESSPELTNDGLTPARNLGWWINCGVLDSPLPLDFEFPRRLDYKKTDLVIFPRGTRVIGSFADRLYDEAELPAIRHGQEKAFYVWGAVTYDDAYEGSWETRFCHNFKFHLEDDGQWKVRGYFNDTHNSAT